MDSIAPMDAKVALRAPKVWRMDGSNDVCHMVMCVWLCVCVWLCAVYGWSVCMVMCVWLYVCGCTHTHTHTHSLPLQWRGFHSLTGQGLRDQKLRDWAKEVHRRQIERRIEEAALVEEDLERQEDVQVWRIICEVCPTLTHPHPPDSP